MATGINNLITYKAPQVVNEFLRQLYGHPALVILDYEDLVNRFKDIVSRLLLPSEFVQLFNLEGDRTEKLISEVRHFAHPTLQSLIDAINWQTSIPSDVIARGIMSTRLNLPYPIYPVLERTYLPVWEKMNVHDGLSTGERTYMETIHNASQRYKRVLRRLDNILSNNYTPV